jgi:hypothetical protein
MKEDLFTEYEEREEKTRQLVEESLAMEEEADDEEEEGVDPTRICWSNLRNDDKRCKILCGFTTDEFVALYTIVEASIRVHSGRGPRSKLSKQDRLLITLCHLKHYETVEKLGKTFSLSKTQLCALLDTTVRSTSPVLHTHFVLNLKDRLEEEEEEEPVNFPEAKLIVNATFQTTWTPPGTMKERVRHYSTKYKSYGFKSQCLHDHKGRVLHCVGGEAGSTSDMSLCGDNLDALIAMLDREEEDQEGEETWSVLCHSGYRGLQRSVSAILPAEKSSTRALTAQQKRHNQELALEMAVCEKFNTRMRSKFRIMSAQYRSSREDYPLVFNLCVALTNYLILNYPL